MHNNESELNLVCSIVDLSLSQFVTGMIKKILTKILMFGKAVVKIPYFDFSKVAMFVTELSKSEDKMSLNCKSHLEQMLPGHWNRY